VTTHPQSVRCPWCAAAPTEPCTVPAGPGARKKLFRQEPLKLTSWHPSRVAAAMTLDGVGEGEIERRTTAVLQAATARYREQPGCAAETVVVAPQPAGKASDDR